MAVAHVVGRFMQNLCNQQHVLCVSVPHRARRGHRAVHVDVRPGPQILVEALSARYRPKPSRGGQHNPTLGLWARAPSRPAGAFQRVRPRPEGCTGVNADVVKPVIFEFAATLMYVVALLFEVTTMTACVSVFKVS
jgi:hypothetical protein